MTDCEEKNKKYVLLIREFASRSNRCHGKRSAARDWFYNLMENKKCSALLDWNVTTGLIHNVLG